LKHLLTTRPGVCYPVNKRGEDVPPSASLSSPRVFLKRETMSKRLSPRKESEIQKAIIDFLAALPGAEFWRVNTTGVYDVGRGKFRAYKGGQYKGVSDIIGFYRGKFWALEVKTPERRGNLTHEQKHFLNCARANGQEAHVVTSLEDAMEVFGFRDACCRARDASYRVSNQNGRSK